MAETPHSDTDTPEKHEHPTRDSLREALRIVWRFIRQTLSLREGIDREGTVEGIVRDVDFRGHVAWILMFSILIASIGLGDNNVAIIVGAMLISPLMGPILGIGLAAGTNDFDLLKRSLSNLAIAVTLSIVVSTLYFLLIDLPETTPELIGRRNASLLSVGIAFFGGAAGIIAGSRAVKNNVVPGVAIATALMPPLCTMGYGIASGQWQYVIGAGYLFFINSVFIALPTYLYIRFIRFPLKQFVDPVKERRIRRYIFIFLILVLVPSAITLGQLFRENRMRRDVNAFVVDLKSALGDQDSYVNFTELDYHNDGSLLRIGIQGEPLSVREKGIWETRARGDLAGVTIRWVDGVDYRSMIDERLRSDREEVMQEALDQQDAEMQRMRDALAQFEEKQEALEEFSQELGLLFQEVDRASYAEVLDLSSAGVRDTVTTVMIWWKDSTDAADIALAEIQMQRWLLAQLKTDEVRVWNMNSTSEDRPAIPGTAP